MKFIIMVGSIVLFNLIFFFALHYYMPKIQRMFLVKESEVKGKSRSVGQIL